MATDYTQTVRRSPEIEAAQENYIDLLTQQVGRAPGSLGVPTLGELGPQIAGQNVLTQQAQQQAATQGGLGQLTFGAEGQVTGVGQGTGVSGYQPFLDQASAYSGPNAYQNFMSPYQQDIIDTTLQEYDLQAQKGLGAFANNAYTAGAFGGARQGVQEAEYMSGSDRNRAQLQASMLGQGFTQANQLANQGFDQQRQLASLQPSLAQTNIQQLGGAGTGNLAYQQALLDAQQQQNQLAYNEPLSRIQAFGSGIASQASGTPTTTTNQSMGGQQSVSPLSGALSAGLSAYGLGSIFGS